MTVLDVGLGGLTTDEASDLLEARLAELGATAATFTVNGTPVSLTADQVGFAVDIEDVLTRALSSGRTGSVQTQFRAWFSSWFSDTHIPLEAQLDQELTQAVLDAWNSSIVGTPPFQGAVAIEGITPVARYPMIGSRISSVDAYNLILGQLSTFDRSTVELPIVTEVPILTDADVDRAVAHARLWLSGPVVLVSEEVEIPFSLADLAGAIRSSISEASTLELSFDPEVIGPILERHRGTVEHAPVDARFVIDGYDVKIQPGRSGTLIDPEQTASALAIAAAGVSRRGTLPVVEGTDPEVTTAELEALDVRHLVSQFTTYHDCCQNRVTNIHLMADKVDGAIVEPGQTFDLNQYVGRRTTEDGYLEDGTIEQGEIVKSVGGGVSQFATTFYNAVFWGGYEDVTHKPHSFYFSRYPEGIEATISWPAPDIKFRNNGDSAILIKTEYTDTSITVQFYSNNDNRVFVGSHRNAKTSMEVVRDGGPDARKVSFTRSERYSPTEPGVQYRANPEVPPGTQVIVQKPAPGWSVTITRTIDKNGGSTTEKWTVRYLAKRQIIEVNPCEAPDATEPCATTTTAPVSTAPATTVAN